MELTWVAAVVSAASLFWSQRRLAALRLAAQRAPERAREVGASSAAASSAGASIAELNELTIDLRALLRAPGFVPQRCGRAALATGTLIALIQVARDLGASAMTSVTAPMLAFACGGIGMIGCAMLGRAAEAEARGLRQHWNSLIRRSRRDVAI
jgi:hypothetical protein